MRSLARLYREGGSPVTVLRSLARHFQRLHIAAGMLAQGRTIEQAVGALKPPPIFKVAPRVKGQVQRWPTERLAAALDLLVQAELDCKTTGLPAEEICARALMQIARAAGRRR